MKRAVVSKYDPAVKGCPSCYRVWHNAQRLCLECGYEFYPSKRVDKSSATFQCAPVEHEEKS